MEIIFLLPITESRKMCCFSNYGIEAQTQWPKDANAKIKKGLIQGIVRNFVISLKKQMRTYTPRIYCVGWI
jgi:hypothetical protein